jgi:murein L,D-transpeptidase YcbB/YkuD
MSEKIAAANPELSLRARPLTPPAVLLAVFGAGSLVLGFLVDAREPAYYGATAEIAIAASHEEAAGAAIEKILGGTAAADAALAEALERLYGAREYRPIWSGSNAAAEAASAAIRLLQTAWEHGLDPADYNVEELARLDPKTITETAAQDVLLSIGALRYARDMRDGRAEARAVDGDVHLPESGDLVAAFGEAIGAARVAEFLADLAPQHEDYARLKVALARYREAVAAGGFPEIPAATRIVQDPASQAMLRLRRRLALEDPALSVTPGADNADVVAALMRYQGRNGLVADGRLTPPTLRRLNVAAEARAAQIAAAMERWRWLPERLEPKRIVVNVPVAMLTAYRDGEPVLTSRVVVGTPETPTPILAAKTHALVVNPPWDVPLSIIRSEILPQLRVNPNYLASQRMRVTGGANDGNWTTGERIHIQQEPGPGNRLGLVKFELDDPAGVTLHDTPAKQVFARADRAAGDSSVRVQEILPLAALALSEDVDRGVRRLEALAGEETRTLALPTSVPVYLIYMTAVPEPDGTVGFKPDVYGRDARLLEAVEDIRRLPPAPRRS